MSCCLSSFLLLYGIFSAQIVMYEGGSGTNPNRDDDVDDSGNAVISGWFFWNFKMESKVASAQTPSEMLDEGAAGQCDWVGGWV